MNKNSNETLNSKNAISKNLRKDVNEHTVDQGKMKFIKEWIIPIISAIAIAFLINKFLFFNMEVMSGSMIPTLNVSDRYVVTKVYNKENLKEGDIIVFYSDELNERLVKRLIGLPGDKIEIKNGIVFRNGEKLNEDYVKNKDTYTYDGTYEVPKGEYFFLGDNRPNSADSRLWKNPYINASSIEGKVQFRFYPFKDFGTVK